MSKQLVQKEDEINVPAQFLKKFIWITDVFIVANEPVGIVLHYQHLLHCFLFPQMIYSISSANFHPFIELKITNLGQAFKLGKLFYTFQPSVHHYQGPEWQCRLGAFQDIKWYSNRYFAAVIAHAGFIFPTTGHVKESYNTLCKFLDCQVISKNRHSSALRTFISTNQR